MSYFFLSHDSSFLLSPKMDGNMHSPRNKSKRLKEKKYFDRFNKLNVYSYVRDNKIYLGVMPENVYELFSNACGRKKGIREDDSKDKKDQGSCTSTIDQSALQYYMILGM